MFYLSIWIIGLAALLVVAASAMHLPIEINPDHINDVIPSTMPSDDFVDKLELEYLMYLETGIESLTIQELKNNSNNFQWMKEKQYLRKTNRLSVKYNFLYCTTCRALVKIIVRIIRNDRIFESWQLVARDKTSLIRKIIIDACLKFNIQTKEVCSGLFDSNWPIIKYIIQNSVIDSYTICSLLMDLKFCNRIDHINFNWSLNIDKNNIQSITGPKKQIPIKSDNDLYILHLTDIHYDPWYVPGSLAECEEPLCCQRYKDKVAGTKQAAGYWGDYRDCDLPWHTLDQALVHINKTHGKKIDFIFQTGDVIDHMVWNTSIQKNKDVYKRVTKRIYELFPNTPVYPCIGNHEPHPLNLFSPDYAPDNLNTHWLYEFLYDLWSKWLPPETKETILKGGYYTLLAKSGYRIIALNNNECYINNWWLFYNGTDLKTQLMWLHDTLLAAEKAGEYVHILAHIPSGDNTCWNIWSREFNRIIERFYHIISGIFNGHSHADEMHVHYSNEGHAIGLSYNGGSLTPWIYKNPNYRIYQVEPESMQVVDHETWIFNLTEANDAGELVQPKWYQEYVFSKEFTDNLSPDGVNQFIEKLSDDINLLRKFWLYKVTMADPELEVDCDQNCLLDTICRIATTVNDQNTRCKELQNRVKKALHLEKSNK